MLPKTRERVREEAEARLAAQPLTDSETASIVDAADHMVRLGAPLVGALKSRHPMRMKRLQRELHWMVEAGARLGIDIRVDL